MVFVLLSMVAEIMVRSGVEISRMREAERGMGAVAMGGKVQVGGWEES